MAGAQGNVYIQIDSKEAQELLQRVRTHVTEQRFTNAMYGIFKRMEGHARTILRKDINRKYDPPSGEVGRAVKRPEISVGGGFAGCVIPIVGPRIPHGQKGKVFKATGGAAGWACIRRPYRVRSRVLKGGLSTLPINSSYGNKHFINTTAPDLNLLAFTREGPDALPIHKVVGIAVPQMPMNRARPEVEKDFERYFIERIEHSFREILDSI